MLVVEIVLLVIAGYALVGIAFAAWFVFAGAGQIDPVAHRGPIGFRLLIFPGSAALWPILLIKLMLTEPREPEA